MTSKYSVVVTGLCIGLLVLCVIFGKKALDAESKMRETQTELQFTYRRLQLTQERLLETGDKLFEVQLDIIQKTAVEENHIVVAAGKEFIANKPTLSNSQSALYDPQTITGKWNGKDWELQTQAGDYIDISEEKVPGSLIATVYRYQGENNNTVFETVLATK